MIQLQVLNKILFEKDVSLITLNNLNSDYFSDYKDEFNFIKDHYEKYGKTPDLATFKEKFPSFDIIEVEEKDSYLIEELCRDKNARSVAYTFNEIRALLKNGEVDKALDMYKKGVENISTGVALESVDIIHDTSRYDAYIERTKDFEKYYVKTGFKELDDLIGGWDREEELATIVARTNSGKCLAKGTKVLMADGTTKCVEDIKVGDKVQSLNRINNVLALHNGTSKGYKIIPNVGEPFVVSENHILTIMQLKETWDKERQMMVTNNEFILKDIMVEDYLKLSNHAKHLSKLYRPSVDYVTKDQLIPPYILGIWLGDGTACRPEITSMDIEVINEWKNFAKSLGMIVTKRPQKSRASAYDIVREVKKGNPENKVLTMLRKYDLLNNKHIPLNYLTGDRQQRLELLAGLLDTDGSFTGAGYEFSQKSRDLIEQVAQLARGLNFKVGNIGVKIVKGMPYYRIHIYGDINNIPMRVNYKHPHKEVCKQPKYIVTGFKIEPIEFVDYYGFQCDGDERYLLADNTLTHNTWILLKSAVAALTQGLTVGIYSGEMSEKKVGYRIDTLLSHISNGALTHGNENVKDQYEKYIQELPKKYKNGMKVLTPKMINGPAGVNALRTFIEKEKLDILFIDQHSLLEDDRRAKTPVEKASNISKDLKNLQVMKRIPIITVSQQNRTKGEEEDKVDTTQIAQSDRIGQDSTNVIAITTDKKDPHIMNFHLIKCRDGQKGDKLTYYTDLNTGTFTFIPSEESSDGKECDKSRYESSTLNDTLSEDEPF